MGIDVVERDDISVYLVAGVPKSFKRKLQKFVEQEAKEAGDIYMLEEELSDWVIAKVRNEKRGGRDRTPATAALWRAFSALSAARYHLQHSPEEEERVRALRNQVEEIWRDLSPMFDTEAEQAGAAQAEAEADVETPTEKEGDEGGG
jgi:hypothetical protein